ncbi:hypothetical protein VaNZ11_011961 [Volvox africanus]|uniref:SBP-type domain-containing protein n=1 Tax=Volvox africanus TaxID=51714 RepID=A0ABQ5SCR2_9CHLO|nr:hypothetical protein VaNZ11_011961 [Volvox africanus]
MATGGIEHAQWAASSVDWNTLTMEAYNTHGTGKKRKPGTSICQVPGCNVDLSDAKPYFKRHCICSTHMKASQVLINGEKMRYCQQCGRFENLDQFVGSNRSCKMSLDRRSAIAQASKQKGSRSIRSRDQQGGREQSTNDNTSSDKGDASGSAWGSPAEVVRTESGMRTAPGDQSCVTRDIDLTADSSNPQSQSLGSRLTGIPANSLTAGVFHDPPALNLRPVGACSINPNSNIQLTCGTHNAPGDDTTVPHINRPLGSAPQHKSAAQLNSSGSIGLAGLNLQPTPGVRWPNAKMSGCGGGGRSGGVDSDSGNAVGDIQGARHPLRSHLGSADAPLPTLLNHRESPLPRAGSKSLAPSEVQPMILPTVLAGAAEWAPPGSGSIGIARVGNGGMGSTAAASVNQTLTYPRLGRLLGGSTQPSLFSAAPSSVVAALGSASLLGIHDPRLEMQLQDIVNSVQLEGQGWYGGASTAAMEVSAYATSGGGGDVAGNGEVRTLCGGVIGGDGVTISQQACQVYGSFAGAEPGSDVSAGLDAAACKSRHFLRCGPGSASLNNAVAGGSINNQPPTSGPSATADPGLWHQAVGDGGSSSHWKADLGPRGHTHGNSTSLGTCIQYLQQQQQQQQQLQQLQQQQQQQLLSMSQRQAYAYGLSNAGGGSGIGADTSFQGIAASMALGPGRRSTRELLRYRPGEPDQLVRMALKLTNRSPDELEPSTIASLRQMLSVYDKLQSVQGYVRPGCTQLIVDAHRQMDTGQPGPAAATGGGRGGAGGDTAPRGSLFDNDDSTCTSRGATGSRFVLGSGLVDDDGSASNPTSSSSSWCDTSNYNSQQSRGEMPLSLREMLIEAGGATDAEALLRNPVVLTALRDIATCNETALICQVDDLALSVGKDGTVGETFKLHDLPTIVAASCAATSPDNAVADVTVYGTNLDSVGVIFWARIHGVCYQLQACASCGGGVKLRLPPLTQVGLLQLEAGTPEGMAVGPSYPLLVLPSAEAVDEVHAIAHAMGPASLRRFIADFGFVLGVNALLSQPLNGVVPAKCGPLVSLLTQTMDNGDSTHSADLQVHGTWGSMESTGVGCRCVGGNGVGSSGDAAVDAARDDSESSRSSDVAFISAVAASIAAAVSSPQLQQAPPRRRAMMSRGSSRNSSPPCSSGAGCGSVLGLAADPTEAMTNADDEQVVELLLDAGAVRNLLETSLALLRVLVDRRMHHCTKLLVSRLCELAERFPDRVHCGLAPLPDPNSGFGMMHSAARAGDVELLMNLMELEGLLGEHCSLFARGINGVTPLHLMAVLPHAPQLLGSLQRLHPEVKQALHSSTADDGTTPLQLYRILHMAGVESQTGAGAGAGTSLPSPARVEEGSMSRTVSVVAGAGAGAGAGPAPLRLHAPLPGMVAGTAALPVDMLLAAAATAELGTPSEPWAAQGDSVASIREVPSLVGRTRPVLLGHRTLREMTAVLMKNLEVSPSADDLLKGDGNQDCSNEATVSDVHTVARNADGSAASQLTLLATAATRPSELSWCRPVPGQQRVYERRQTSQLAYSTAPTSMAHAMLEAAACGSPSMNRRRNTEAVSCTRTSTATARLVGVTSESAATSAIAWGQQSADLKHPLPWPSFLQLTGHEVAVAAGTGGDVSNGGAGEEVAMRLEAQGEAWTVQGKESNTATAAVLRNRRVGVSGHLIDPIEALVTSMIADERLAAVIAQRAVDGVDDSACGGEESVASTSSFGASNSTCCSVRNAAAAIAVALGASEPWTLSTEASCWARPPVNGEQRLLQQQRRRGMPSAPPAEAEAALAEMAEICTFGFDNSFIHTLPEETEAQEATLTRRPDSVLAAAVGAAPTVAGVKLKRCSSSPIEAEEPEGWGSRVRTASACKQ